MLGTCEPGKGEHRSPPFQRTHHPTMRCVSLCISRDRALGVHASAYHHHVSVWAGMVAVKCIESESLCVVHAKSKRKQQKQKKPSNEGFNSQMLRGNTQNQHEQQEQNSNQLEMGEKFVFPHFLYIELITPKTQSMRNTTKKWDRGTTELSHLQIKLISVTCVEGSLRINSSVHSSVALLLAKISCY